MALKEERLQILQMLKDDKVTVQEAARLLEALDQGKTVTAPKNIVVKVTEHGRTTANVNLPVTLAKLAVKVVPQEILGEQNIDVNEILSQIEAGFQGKVVEVFEPLEQRKVEIYLE